MDAVVPGVHAELFRFARRTLDIRRVLDLVAEGFQFGPAGIVPEDLFHQRVFRRDDDEGDAVNRVGTGRIDGQFFAQVGNVEAEFQTFGTADPVLLHGFDALGPAGNLVHVLQQLIGVIGDLEEPLAQAFLVHFVVAAPALAFDDLFVGQHGVAMVAPVDGRLLFHSQAALIEQFEEPLGPFIVFRFARNDFPVPVIGQAHGLQLPCHVGDVVHGPFLRRDAMLDSGIFGRHAERVEAHGMQDIEAPHGAETRHYIADGVVAHMTHMQVARRIREHFQHIGFRFRFVFFTSESFMLFPILLPFCFYGMGRIFFFHK